VRLSLAHWPVRALCVPQHSTGEQSYFFHHAWNAHSCCRPLGCAISSRGSGDEDAAALTSPCCWSGASGGSSFAQPACTSQSRVGLLASPSDHFGAARRYNSAWTEAGSGATAAARSAAEAAPAMCVVLAHDA
jgi:hypothetical protein